MSKSAPARDYLHLTQDALTFMRYAERALAAAEQAAPDAPSNADTARAHANCRVAFGQLKEARNRTLSRYTPRGASKSKLKPPNTTKRDRTHG